MAGMHTCIPAFLSASLLKSVELPKKSIYMTDGWEKISNFVWFSMVILQTVKLVSNSYKLI